MKHSIMKHLSFFFCRQECFICCTQDGKTEVERSRELMENRKTIGYPIISLSHAYGCRCHNSFAHNKCLRQVVTCPTCRKQVSKPNLRVDTWMNRRLCWIRDNPALYKERLTYFFAFVLVLFFISLAAQHEYIQIHPYFMGVILLCMFSAQFVVMLDDSLNKYWLYDEKRKAYY